MANVKPGELEYRDVVEWRPDLRAHPELLYDVHRTASFVAAKLKKFVCHEIATRIGRTGVVGLFHGRRRTSGKVIGLRADMDALPIEETTGVPWAFSTQGQMHARGHDGRTAMLLGAAQLLRERANSTAPWPLSSNRLRWVAQAGRRWSMTD
jgi:metal-dependent amidase/aminoacylase/carboxypeptidase family protein